MGFAKLREESLYALALSGIAVKELCGVFCSLCSIFLFFQVEVNIQHLQVVFVRRGHRLGQPFGQELDLLPSHLGPGGFWADPLCQDGLLAGQFDVFGKEGSKGLDEVAVLGQVALPQTQAADIGCVKGQGLSQGVVFRACQAHQEIQFFGDVQAHVATSLLNGLFVLLYPVFSMNQLTCHNIDKFVIDKSVKQLYIFKTLMYDKFTIEMLSKVEMELFCFFAGKGGRLVSRGTLR